MKNKRRRRKKKGSVVIRKMSYYIEICDPSHLICAGMGIVAIAFPFLWWLEGWDKAVLAFKVFFFFSFSMSAGLYLCAMIYEVVKGEFMLDSLVHVVVKSVIVAIALIAMEDDVRRMAKVSIAGFGFAAVIFCFTIISGGVLSWFKK